MSLRPLTSFKTVGEDVCISKSSLLFSLLAPKQDGQRLEILDIGPAKNCSIQALSELYCKIYIRDCMSELCAVNTSLIETPQKLNRKFIHELQFYKNNPAKLDVILLWDIINYLDSAILKSFIQYLIAHTDKNAHIHAFIHTSRLMPEEISQYEILDNEQIRHDNHSPVTRNCPMYFRDSLNKQLAPFKVQRSVLHANGIQEYLFTQ